MPKSRSEFKVEVFRLGYERTVRNFALARQAEALNDGPEKDRLLLVKKNLEDWDPIIDELRSTYPGLDLLQLYYPTETRPKILPVLISWLPVVSNLDVKAGIIRFLTDKWVGGSANAAILEELRRLTSTAPKTQENDVRLAFMAASLSRSLRRDDTDLVIEALDDNNLWPNTAANLLTKARLFAGTRLDRTLSRYLNDSDRLRVIAALKAIRSTKRVSFLVSIRRLSESSDHIIARETAKAVAALEGHQERSNKKRAR